MHSIRTTKTPRRKASVISDDPVYLGQDMVSGQRVVTAVWRLNSADMIAMMGGAAILVQVHVKDGEVAGMAMNLTAYDHPGANALSNDLKRMG
jgi:hypothetical protein